MDADKLGDDLVDTKVERIELSDEAFDNLNKSLKESMGKPNPELVKLMSRPKRWAKR